MALSLKIIFLIHHISYFSVAIIKDCDQKKLREKRVVWAYSSKTGESAIPSVLSLPLAYGFEDKLLAGPAAMPLLCQ